MPVRVIRLPGSFVTHRHRSHANLLRNDVISSRTCRKIPLNKVPDRDSNPGMQMSRSKGSNQCEYTIVLMSHDFMVMCAVCLFNLNKMLFPLPQRDSDSGCSDLKAARW